MEVTRKAGNILMRPDRLGFYESSSQALLTKGFLSWIILCCANALLIQTLKTLCRSQTCKIVQLGLIVSHLIHLKSCLERTTLGQQMDACMNSCMSSTAND